MGVIDGSLSGIISASLVIGGGTANTFRLKANGTVMEARNAADSAYVIVRGLDPVGANDLVTLSYAQTNFDTSGSVRTIAITLALATANSTTTFIAGCRVIDAWLDVTTAYDANATWALGIAGTTSKFMATTDNIPGTINLYTKTQYTAQATAVAFLATLANVPTVGAATALAFYTTPDT